MDFRADVTSNDKTAPGDRGGSGDQNSRAALTSSLSSSASRKRLRSRPPPNPVNDPSLPTTRWHGTTSANGLLPVALPTACDKLIPPSLVAIDP